MRFKDIINKNIFIKNNKNGMYLNFYICRTYKKPCIYIYDLNLIIKNINDFKKNNLILEVDENE